jgi:hypothetical protein
MEMKVELFDTFLVGKDLGKNKPEGRGVLEFA